MRLHVVILIVAWLLILGGPVSAAEQSGEGVTFLGAGFTARPFALDADLILETDGAWNCLRDYGVAPTPAWVGWHDVRDSGGFWREVLWEDGLAVSLQMYLAAGARFVDYSDPTAPVVVGEISGNTYTSGLLRNRLLYLTTENLLLVYDLADPATPVFRFALPLATHGQPRWFTAIGDMVYFVETGTTVRALEVSVPEEIEDLGTFTLPGDRLDALATSPGTLHALVATELAPDTHLIDLVTYELVAPLQPVETDRHELAAGLGARGLQLRRRDELLLAAENQAATHAFDLTEPRHPTGGFTLPVAAQHLAITAGRVLTQVSDEVRVYTRTVASDPPELLSTRHTLPRLQTVSGHGPTLLGQSAKDRSLLFGLDVTNPVNPHSVSAFDTGLDGVLHHHHDLAVMVLDEDVQILNVADPTAPVRLATLRLILGTKANNVALSADLLAIGMFIGQATDLFDLTDPRAPIRASRLEQTDEPLALSSNLMIHRDDDHFGYYDLTNPYQPIHRGPLAVDGVAIHAAIDQTRAYLLTEVDDLPLLSVVDIADPTLPTLTATLPVDQFGTLVAHGTRLYIRHAARLQVIDITEPDAPAPTAWIDLAFPADNWLGTHEDLIFVGPTLVAARDDAWSASDTPETPPPPYSSIVSVFPNPFNPHTTVTFTVDRARELTVSVYDLRGRLVVELARAVFERGEHEVAWYGDGAGGRGAASGVYLVRLSGEGVESTAAVTLVR